MALMRPPASVARGEFDELAQLWIVGVNTSHVAGCACGGIAMPSIAAGDIERDFLGYLAGKYRASAELSALLAARLTTPVGAFENWLGKLGDEPLTIEARANLINDLRVFLESLGARSRFSVCY